MKKRFLLTLLCFAGIFASNAKNPIKFDFENGLPTTIRKYCNDATWAARYDDAVVIDNAYKTGINTSNKVLKFNNTNGQLQWQGFKIKFDTPIPLTDLATDSISKITIKFYETTPYVKASNPSVKLLLTWDGQYFDSSNQQQGTYAEYGTDNAGGIATDINPTAVDGTASTTVDHQQKWSEVEFAFNSSNYSPANLEQYYQPTTYKEIVGIAFSPVRGYGTPGSYPYTVLIDDITIHFKSKVATSLNSTKITPEALNVHVNGDLATVSFNLSKSTDTEVSMYNITGQLINTQTVHGVEGINKTSFNVPMDGVYVIKVKSNNNITTAKFKK